MQENVDEQENWMNEHFHCWSQISSEQQRIGSGRRRPSSCRSSLAGVGVGLPASRWPTSRAHEQGFFYRPKFTEIFEISFLSTGSDKI